MDRVLVVEDEPSLRTDLVDYLSAKGFAAEGTATVAETRDRLRSQSFDAVILDIAAAGLFSAGRSCGDLLLTRPSKIYSARKSSGAKVPAPFGRSG